MVPEERTMDSDRQCAVHPIKIKAEQLKYIKHGVISLFLFGVYPYSNRQRIHSKGKSNVP